MTEDNLKTEIEGCLDAAFGSNVEARHGTEDVGRWWLFVSAGRGAQSPLLKFARDVCHEAATGSDTAELDRVRGYVRQLCELIEGGEKRVAKIFYPDGTDVSKFEFEEEIDPS